MQDELRKLVEGCCETLAHQLRDIDRHLRRIEDGEGMHDTLVLALDLTHQIAGLSGTMGFRDVAIAARELERFMRDFETAATLPEGDDLALLRLRFETLRSHGEDATPEASALYHTDLAQFASGRG